MKQNTTESFRIEKDILDNIKLITKRTGQTAKGYISVILKKQTEKDLKKILKTESMFADYYKCENIPDNLK